MGIQSHKEMREHKHKLDVLPIDHTIECLFTTNLLVPALAIKYCTFLLEFMEKDAFPQFKPLMTYKIFKVMYCNRLKDINP
jgi:hypothetical protein